MAGSGVTNPFIELSNRFSCWSDNKKDIKICGQKLGDFVPTPFAQSYGATGSQSAPYLGLETVLADLKLGADDSIIDIGCGKGRVIAYLISRGYSCKITGVEINSRVAHLSRAAGLKSFRTLRSTKVMLSGLTIMIIRCCSCTVRWRPIRSRCSSIFSR